ncbi:MAG: hypothetical protein HQL11_06245, partial [Candidatus Omnitrophica bacterium]|nr:hypothetical protein [Candidatus Omnitrophota bacterium]
MPRNRPSSDQPWKTHYRKVPDRYLAEFIRQETILVRNRIRLMCFMVPGIYFLASGLSWILIPVRFRPAETVLWGMLIFFCVLVGVLNGRVRTRMGAEKTAFLLAVCVLVLLVLACVIYPEDMGQNATVFLFTFFLIAFSIPWSVMDLVWLALLHWAAYTLSFALVQKQFLGVGPAHFDMEMYFNGAIYLLMALVFGAAIRRRDVRRTIQNFVLMKDIEEKNIQAERDLDLATRIHKTLVPAPLASDALDAAVAYLPMQKMGGDYAKF